MAWSVGGIKLERENGISRIYTCRNATLSTTNPTDTGQGSNPGLCGN